MPQEIRIPSRSIVYCRLTSPELRMLTKPISRMTVNRQISRGVQMVLFNQHSPWT